MKLIFKIGFLFVLGVFVAACTNTRSLPQEKREQINTISIPKPGEVVFPQEAFFYSHGQGLAMGFGAALGGVVGAVVAGSDYGEKSEEQMIERLLAEGPTPFSNSLVDILRLQILKNTHFKVVDGDRSDAEFRLKVVQYGLSYVPFSKSYKPILILEAELIMGDLEEVMWRKKVAVYSTSKLGIKRHLKDWLGSSQYMKEGMLFVADNILEEMTLHMVGKKPSNTTSEPTRRRL